MTDHPQLQPGSALEREIEQVLFGRIMKARLEGYTVETARQIMELIAAHRGSGVQAGDASEQIAWWEEQYSRQAVKIERLTTERDQLLSALKNAPQCGVQTRDDAAVARLLTKIADLVDDEDACEPLDDAIRYANEALAILAPSSLSSAPRAGVQSERDAAIDECADMMQRWANDAAEFVDSDRCKLQHNVCRSASVALRNLKNKAPPLSSAHSRSEPCPYEDATECLLELHSFGPCLCALSSTNSRAGQ